MNSPQLPPVSVFMTVRNEEDHLEACVDRLLAQDYAGPIEIVVAVGPSDDATAHIAQRLADQHGIIVVENPTGLTPHGLNAAIAAASHDYLVRCDGHALLPLDYVSRVVAVLEETGAANAGGRMVPEGTNPLGRAVAHAMSSRLGLGGAAFHTGGEPGPQLTVYLGSFRRDAVESVGGYDEYFLRAQDWELNHRLRAAGHTVWFDPSIGVTYRPRATWRDLARQQYRTGAWRRKVVRRYPETASLRYLAPPVAVSAMILAILIGGIGSAFSPWFSLAYAIPLAYVAVVVVAGLFDGRNLPWSSRLRLPGVLAVIHWSWGLGFLAGKG